MKAKNPVPRLSFLAAAVAFAFSGSALAAPSLTFSPGTGYTLVNGNRYAIISSEAALSSVTSIPIVDSNPALDGCNHYSGMYKNVANSGEAGDLSFSPLNTNCQWSAYPSGTFMGVTSITTLTPGNGSQDFYSPVVVAMNPEFAFYELKNAYGGTHIGNNPGRDLYFPGGLTTAGTDFMASTQHVGKYMGKQTVPGYETPQHVVSFGSFKVQDARTPISGNFHAVITYRDPSDQASPIFAGDVTPGQNIPLTMVVSDSTQFTPLKTGGRISIVLSDGSGLRMSSNVYVTLPERGVSIYQIPPSGVGSDPAVYKLRMGEIIDKVAHLNNNTWGQWVVSLHRKSDDFGIGQVLVTEANANNIEIPVENYTFDDLKGQRLVFKATPVNADFPIGELGDGNIPQTMKDNSIQHEFTAPDMNSVQQTPIYDFTNASSFKYSNGQFNDAQIDAAGLVKIGADYYNIVTPDLVSFSGEVIGVVRVGQIKIPSLAGMDPNLYSVNLTSQTKTLFFRTKNSSSVTTAANAGSRWHSSGDIIEVFSSESGDVFGADSFDYSLSGITSDGALTELSSKNVKFTYASQVFPRDISFKPSLTSATDDAAFKISVDFKNASDLSSGCCDQYSGQWKYNLVDVSTSAILASGDVSNVRPDTKTMDIDLSNGGARKISELLEKQYRIEFLPKPPQGVVGNASILGNQHTFTPLLAGAVEPVGGSISVSTAQCTMPCTVNLSLQQTAGQTKATGSIKWLSIRNRDAASETQLPGTGFTNSFTPTQPGSYQITASLIDKNTGASYTTTTSVIVDPAVSNTGGTIQAAVNECSLPCTPKLTLVQNASQIKATQSIQWFSVEMATEKVTQLTGGISTTNLIPTNGGVFEVYAVLTDKVTGEKINTERVSITIHEAPKVTVSAVDIALPADTVTVTAAVLTPSGKVAKVDNELGYVVSGEVYQGDSTTPLAVFPSTTVINFTPTAFMNSNGMNPAAGLTNEQYRFVFKAYPASLSGDAKSHAVAEKVVTFTMPLPTVDVKPPALVESGKPVTLTATVVPGWKGLKTNLKTETRWLSGTTELGRGEKLVYTPAISEVPSSTPRAEVITVETRVVGAEEATLVSKSVTVNVYDYLMPTFSVKSALDSGYAPANLRLTVSPINITEAKKMSGKKYTYTWSVPEGFVGTAKGSTLFGRADLPGTYPISVTVTDNLENSVTHDYSLVLEQMKPYVFSLVAKPGLTYERAPMTYFLKPVITGGHPKDRIKLATMTIDGQVVGTPSYKLPGVITGLEAGSHEITIDFESNLGQTATATTTVNVAENQPPVVTLTAKPITRSTGYVVLPAYKDPDGKIRKIEWFIDGEPTGKSSSSLTIDMKSRPDTTVSIKVTDDSAASTEASVVVPGGNGGSASVR